MLSTTQQDGMGPFPDWPDVSEDVLVSDALVPANSSRFTPAQMTEMNVGEVIWRGRSYVARHNEWVFDASSGDARDSDVAAVVRASGAGDVIDKALGRKSTLLLRNLDAGGIWELAESLAARGVVGSVTPNYIGQTTQTPNDSAYASQLWGLNNTGQNGGTVDADIDAPEAWDATTGGTGVAIGVIDTGIDYRHPDLYRNIWINQAEIPATELSALTDTDSDGLFTFYDLNHTSNAGVVPELGTDSNSFVDGGDVLAHWSDSSDADGNTYTDDIIGWDFSSAGNGDNDPMDDARTTSDGHGTHVAGIAGGVGNNGFGVPGVAWKTQLVAMKVFQDQAVDLADVTTAVNYATSLKDDGVNVRALNGSFGTIDDLDDATDPMKLAIDEAGAEGILYVAASGNFAEDNDGNGDASPTYPASFSSDNIISVAASDRFDRIASFSNYGLTTVDLIAPGVSIYSTKRNSTYGVLSGTSMAAPYVAGVVALAFSHNTGASYQDVKQAIFRGADFNASAQDVTATGRRLNAHRAVNLIRAPLVPIDGTDNADTIVVQMSGSNVQVIVNSVQQYSGAASGVSWIRLNAKGGNDSVTVSSAVNIPTLIDAGSGNDTVTGGAANDYLIGGDGNDSVTSGAGDDFITTGAGNDSLAGGDNVDVLMAGDNDSGVKDTLAGDAGNDVLVGELGDDDLTGGTGDDTYLYLTNSSGVDTVYEHVTTAVGGTDMFDINYLGAGFQPAIDLAAAWNDPSDPVAMTVGAEVRLYNAVDTLDNTTIENVRGHLGWGDYIYGNSLNNVIWGGTNEDEVDGADQIFGYGGNDTIYGEVGADWIEGGDGNDTIYGGATGDVIYGGAGADTIYGDAGNDSFVAEPVINGGMDGADVFNGGSGIDTTTYLPRAYNISASLDNVANDGYTGEGDNVKNDVEILVGSQSNDVLDAAASVNPGSNGFTLRGGPGADTLHGSGGVDNLWGEDGADTLYGYGGADTLDGGASSDVLFGGNDNDTMYGRDGDDTFYGGDGHDYLEGGLGGDTLNGENGDDTFNTSDGVTDWLYGGAGTGDTATVRDTGDAIPLADIENT